VTAGSSGLEGIATSALEVPGIESAAIFIVQGGSSTLTFAAAAGVEGSALEALIAAVGNPGHPIARTLSEGHATFDVVPVAPGGPALRSHLPIVVERDGRRDPAGVLAVAHDQPLGEAERRALARLAATAAEGIAAGQP
jgi:hypothetical protein